MSRTLIASLVAVAVVGAATPARAQITHAASFNAGYFALHAEDARPAGDVLVENLNYFVFLPKDFNGATAGADWLIGVGDFIDLGVGVSYFKRTVPSVYREYINVDGFEIPQDFKLRIVPLSFTLRFLPVSRHAPVVPYVGAGVAAYAWRYSETGEFIDLADFTIFRATYVDQGTEVAPVYLGGLWVPAGDVFAVGAEFRYQPATADLDPNVGFFGDEIDLGGWLSLVTFQIRF